jgi:hypothetical protein
MKYWELIADNLSNAGWSWGCVSAIDSNGRTIWIAGAHRDDGKRFVVRADEKLTAFLELESATREHAARASATTLYSMRASLFVARPHAPAHPHFFGCQSARTLFRSKLILIPGCGLRLWLVLR